MTVVGIGASAGGLKALQQFVAAIPADGGMAYGVVVHLDPARESRLAELLQDRTSLPVTQVGGPTAVEANHVYIIPPGEDLAMRGTTLSLRERGERSEHAPVDLFFRTLAETYGAEAVGVVLSGTGSDGTAGIRYIREAGGITAAQSPAEAEYDGMPASAIATGLVDLVLPSSHIPAELHRLRQPVPLEIDGASAATGLAEVFAALHSRTGHDFSLYKESMILRRLDRRLRFNQMASLQDYMPLLRSSAAECQALLRDLLISVSSFFRDPGAFDALTAQLPSLFEGKGSLDSVRVWVVGCATGEEAYSIAMILAEHAALLAEAPRIQVFATDIDEKGYASGRAGLYSAAAVVNVAPERLHRFFTKEPGGYRIAKSLRELVLFAGHDVLRDPPFSRMDLISCRNLFIYLQPEAQQKILETFRFALIPDGILFLGAAESVGESGLFVAIDGGAERLFRRSTAPYRAMPRSSAADPLPRRGMATAIATAPTADPSGQRFSYGALHLRMLEQYAPASMIVNERLEVVHLSADAGRFLRVGGGEPSHNLLDLAPKALRSVLRTALHQAFRNHVRIERKVSMDVAGTLRAVSVDVRPAASISGSAGRFALIIFEVAEPPGNPVVGGVEPDGSGSTSGAMELEEELRRTRDLLDSTTAAHDLTVAELQAVNEELRSINEEQKAAGEELETGREEIQSINEELITINQEYQSTIEELRHTNADLQNLIESTEIGTIFLDRNMRIRRYTPAVCVLFNFVATDQGRAFTHITHRLQYPDLIADVLNVLATLERIERELMSDEDKSYVMRINPYRSPEGGNDGVVLTFFDNTAQHRIRQELQEAKIAAESANLAKSTFLSTISHEFRTPLNGILGYAHLLDLDHSLDVEQTHRVGRIKAGGAHLLTMIEEILSFAKLDGRQEVIHAEPLDARSIAQEAAALLEPAAGAKGLAFVLDIPDTPVPLVTDGPKARQVLINLCGNAVKYTDKGEVRLRVRRDDGRVRFEVRDTGIGIAPEHLTRIFERFWRADESSTRTVGGLGIGLAAAKEYALLLRGDLEVNSELGRGTTFGLWLPGQHDQH